jgi:hypothetical protein
MSRGKEISEAIMTPKEVTEFLKIHPKPSKERYPNG